MRSFNVNKGSITLEAAIIFPVIFLFVMLLIYISIFTYQKVYIRLLTESAVLRGTSVWDAPAKDMFIGMIKKDKLEENSLYWRIFSSSDEENYNKMRVEQYMLFNLSKYSLLGKPTDLKVNIDIINEFVVYKKLKVTVDVTYKNPAGRMLKIFGMSDMVLCHVVYEEPINEPAEFVRNVDFAVDTMREIDNKCLGGKGSKVLSDADKSVSQTFGKIRDLILMTEKH